MWSYFLTTICTLLQKTNCLAPHQKLVCSQFLLRSGITFLHKNDPGNSKVPTFSYSQQQQQASDVYSASSLWLGDDGEIVISSRVDLQPWCRVRRGSSRNPDHTQSSRHPTCPYHSYAGQNFAHSWCWIIMEMKKQTTMYEHHLNSISLGAVILFFTRNSPGAESYRMPQTPFPDRIQIW